MQSFVIRLVYVVVWFSNLTFWLYVLKVRSALGHFPGYKMDVSPVELGINSRLADWAIRIAFGALWVGAALFIDAVLFNRARLRVWDVLLFLGAAILFVVMIYSRSFSWYLN